VGKEEARELNVKAHVKQTHRLNEEAANKYKLSCA